MNFLSEIPSAYKTAKNWVDPSTYNEDVGEFIDEYTSWEDWSNQTLAIDPISLDEFDDVDKKITWIENNNENPIVKKYNKSSLRGLMRFNINANEIPLIQDPATRTQIPIEVVTKLREPEILSSSSFLAEMLNTPGGAAGYARLRDLDWNLEVLWSFWFHSLIICSTNHFFFFRNMML